MTREEPWAAISARYPGGANLTLEGMGQMFNLIWDHAFEAGIDHRKGVEAAARKLDGFARTGGNPLDDLVATIRGGGK